MQSIVKNIRRVFSTSSSGSGTVVPGSEAVLGYKVYSAVLVQSGTDAPIANILNNTLGVTITWTYDSIGVYIGTLSNVFSSSNTMIIFSNYDPFFLPASVIGVIVQSQLEIKISTGNNFGPMDNAFTGGLSLEIRVYP